MSLSEHERILKIEEQELPQLKIDITSISEAIDDLRQESLETEISLVAASNPTLYRKRKTYGSGNKQVAHEEFDLKKNLNKMVKNNCVVYTAKKPKKNEDTTVTLTITHSDGTTQVWTIKDKPDDPQAMETKKVTICYDKNGNPSSLYID